LLLISSCDQKPEEKTTDQKAVKSLVQESLNNMVDIQGGSFMMGDFGSLVGGNFLSTEIMMTNRSIK